MSRSPQRSTILTLQHTSSSSQHFPTPSSCFFLSSNQRPRDPDLKNYTVSLCLESRYTHHLSVKLPMQPYINITLLHLLTQLYKTVRTLDIGITDRGVFLEKVGHNKQVDHTNSENRASHEHASFSQDLLSRMYTNNSRDMMSNSSGDQRINNA